MKDIRKFLKRLFCNHDYKHMTTMHIPHEIRVYYKCNKCGKSICEKYKI